MNCMTNAELIIHRADRLEYLKTQRDRLNAELVEIGEAIAEASDLLMSAREIEASAERIDMGGF